MFVLVLNGVFERYHFLLVFANSVSITRLVVKKEENQEKSSNHGVFVFILLMASLDFFYVIVPKTGL